MIRAVLIGFAHMHINEIALYLHEHPDYTLVGCADIPPEAAEKTEARYTRAWNLRHVASEFSVPVFGDYQRMLEETHPDIAFVLCENFRKPEVAWECARRGVNVSIEKPIAVDYAGALRIRAAQETCGVEILVNWPTTWRPYMLQMRRAAASGMIGDIIKMYYINGHTGPLGKGARHRGVDADAEEMTDEQRTSTWWYHEKTGGGVYLDIGCYGCMYSRLFQKERARSVQAFGMNLNTPYCDTADNLAAWIRYPHSYSLIEGTWTSPQCVLPTGPILTGTEGVLFCTRGEEGQPQVRMRDIYGAEHEVPAVDFPKEYTNIAWHYAHHRTSGAPLDATITLSQNMDVMALLDTLIRSAKSGTAEDVPQ